MGLKMTDKEILELTKSGLPSTEIAERLMKAGVSAERFGDVLSRDTKWFMIKGAVFTLIVCGIMFYVTFFVL